MSSRRAGPRTSDSWIRLKPSIADPSKVMPSSRAFSSSAGVMLNVFGVPRTSVNQSCTKRMARSSTVLKTYSCWLRMSPPMRPCDIGPIRFSQAGEPSRDRARAQVHRAFTNGQRGRNEAVRILAAIGAGPGCLAPEPDRGSTPSSAVIPQLVARSRGSPQHGASGTNRTRQPNESSQGGDVQQRTPADVLRLVQDEGVEIVDLRFIDLPGLTQHFSVPAHALTDDVFEEGIGFDGSSIRGFQEIQESDMLLFPDPNTAVLDPFRQHKTLNLNCFVRDPITLESYSRDPRYVAQKAEAYLKTTGVADTCYFGPEAEFFIFNDVRYSQDQNSAFYEVDSIEGHWNSGERGKGRRTRTSVTRSGRKRATSRFRRPTTSRTCAPR